MSEHGDSPTRAGELALRRLEAERITREKKVAGVRTLDWDGKEVVWLGGWVPSPKHENEFYSTLLTP